MTLFKNRLASTIHERAKWNAYIEYTDPYAHPVEP